MSVNNHTISDVFQFAEEIRELDFNEDDILVSYDVSALFLNKNIKYKKQKPTKKPHTKNVTRKTIILVLKQLKATIVHYKTRSKKLQSCNLLLKSLASLERRTREGKLFHNLANE